jgi:hypothetical protein
MNKWSGTPKESWTNDPVLATTRFTNTFRILDHGSQFLLKELIYDPTATRLDVLARIVLYRFVNRPEPWIYARSRWGRYPNAMEIINGYLENLWHKYDEGSLYNNCYTVVFPRGHRGADTKLTSLMEVTKSVWEVLAELDLISTPVEDLFSSIKDVPGVGDFFTMQWLTDISYSWLTDRDNESEFVVPGPGSRRGCRIYNPDRSAEYTLNEAYEALSHDYVDNKFKSPVLQIGRTVRYLSIMDVQNCFCEFQKYMRVFKGTSTGVTYTPRDNNNSTIYFPPKYTKEVNNGPLTLIECTHPCRL